MSQNHCFENKYRHNNLIFRQQIDVYGSSLQQKLVWLNFNIFDAEDSQI